MSRPVLRVRKSGALLVAALIALIGTLPFAGTSWALAPVLLIPLAIFVWALRAGTDVYPDRVRVRALLGSTSYWWNEIDELAPDERGRVHARLTNGNVVRLTGVNQKDLPGVLAAAGQEVSNPRSPD